MKSRDIYYNVGDVASAIVAEMDVKLRNNDEQQAMDMLYATWSGAEWEDPVDVVADVLAVRDMFEKMGYTDLYAIVDAPADQLEGVAREILPKFGFELPEASVSLSGFDPKIDLALDYFRLIQVSQLKESACVAPAVSSLADVEPVVSKDNVQATAQALIRVSPTIEAYLQTAYGQYDVNEYSFYRSFPGQLIEDRTRRDRMQNLFIWIAEARSTTFPISLPENALDGLGEFTSLRKRSEYLAKFVPKLDELAKTNMQYDSIVGTFPELVGVINALGTSFVLPNGDSNAVLGKLLDSLQKIPDVDVFEGLEVVRLGKKIVAVAGPKEQIALLELLSFCIEDLKGNPTLDSQARIGIIGAYLSEIRRECEEIDGKLVYITSSVNNDVVRVIADKYATVDLDKACIAYNLLVESVRKRSFPIDEAWAIWCLFSLGKLSVDDPVAKVIIEEICGIQIDVFKKNSLISILLR